MSNINRGKQFEQQIREAFEKVPGCSVDRLPDQMSGFAGSSNICDLIVYRYPNMFYLECKSCYGNTLNFSNISDKQWDGLLKKSEIPGCVAGVLVWFIDHDKTIFVSVRDLQFHKDRDFKSINVKHLEDDNWYFLELEGKKKRVLFEYDAAKFLKEWE